MKKVFLSLAVVAVLTVVSCKKAEAPAEEVAVDTTAVAVDTASASSGTIYYQASPVVTITGAGTAGVSAVPAVSASAVDNNPPPI